MKEFCVTIKSMSVYRLSTPEDMTVEQVKEQLPSKGLMGLGNIEKIRATNDVVVEENT